MPRTVTEDVFGRLVEQEIQRLRRYARALTCDRERADDLVQDCLTRALAKQHLWQPGTDLRAWLFTILHYSRVGDLRPSGREALRNRIAIKILTPLPSGADSRLELLDLHRAIGKLPEHQRQVLLLVGLEGISYGQAAAVIGVPVGTVRSRIARARESLRAELGHLPIRHRHAAMPTGRHTEPTLARV